MRRQRRAIAKGDRPSVSFRHWDELAVAPSSLVWEEVTPGVAPKAAAALQARASAARVAAVHCDSVLVMRAGAQLGAALAGVVPPRPPKAHPRHQRGSIDGRHGRWAGCVLLMFDELQAGPSRVSKVMKLRNIQPSTWLPL